jgi:MarR family transcriptional regulator, organic hydroperoxide resistance regulator
VVERDWGSPERAAAEVMGQFLRIQRHVGRGARRVSQDLGISGRMLAALRHLVHNPEATIGELSRHLYVRKSSTSELVRKLEDRGLVQRRRSDRDNRVVRVNLTDAGTEVVDRAPLTPAGLLRDRLPAQSAEDLAKIGWALDRLTELLDLEPTQS